MEILELSNMTNDKPLITEFEQRHFQLEDQIFNTKKYLCVIIGQNTRGMTYNGLIKTISCGCGMGPGCPHKKQFKLSFPHLF